MLHILVAHAVRNCYVVQMQTNLSRSVKATSVKATVKSTLEKKAVILFSFIFVVVMITAWVYAFQLRQTVATQNSSLTVDPSALVELERIRNMLDSKISAGRSFFLLGSRALFDKQKKDKLSFLESIVSFEKKYSLPHIPEIMRRIESLEQQQQGIFDQAMDFREKQTESKIVGQFYHSKIAPIYVKMNEAIDEIVSLHYSQLNQDRERARIAALDAETQIPKGMTWLTGFVGFLFLGMVLLVLGMLKKRELQIAERDRLYLEAKKAVQDRDELKSAIAHDLKEHLSAIVDTAESMAKTGEENSVTEGQQLIKSMVTGIESVIKDICDQKTADNEGLTLRLDQLNIDEVLDEARMTLQPIAKQRDIRLQFESVNPPVLAFFDRERVLRVLSNLVGNAIKFSPKHSRVVIKVKSDQKFVYISVVNNGPGIPDKQLTEIFDHFWQAQKTANLGAGIGLKIVKTIVDAHGGTIKAESSGNGNTFTFSLPRRRPVGVLFKNSSFRQPTSRSQTSVEIQGESQI